MKLYVKFYHLKDSEHKTIKVFASRSMRLKTTLKKAFHPENRLFLYTRVWCGIVRYILLNYRESTKSKINASTTQKWTWVEALALSVGRRAETGGVERGGQRNETVPNVFLWEIAHCSLVV